MAKVLICSTQVHPRNIDFPSKTQPGVVHTVITEWLLGDAVCTCPGWNFRGKCSHIDAVPWCDWWAPPDTPNITECPNCGGPVEIYELSPEFT